MAENDPSEVNPDVFPGVDLAYDIAIASYDTIIKRIDGMDSRIQTMLAFAATTTAVVPTVAKGTGLGFRSGWLYFALLAFVVQLVVGFYARNHAGLIRLLRPRDLYEKWLRKNPWLFKKDMIYFAAVDFDQNNRLLELRWRLNVAMTILLFVEVLLLLAWVAWGPRVGTP